MQATFPSFLTAFGLLLSGIAALIWAVRRKP